MPTTETGEVLLQYELSGNQHGETLVLTNSLGSNLHSRDKLVRIWESTFRVLRFDTRGPGKSNVLLGSELDASHRSAWEQAEQSGSQVVAFLKRAEVGNG